MSCQWLPQEMADAIIDNLENDHDSLRACSTVCKGWTVRARRHLFESVDVSSEDLARFLISGRAITPFIRHISLEDFRGSGRKKWNEHLPLLANQPFNCVQSLILIDFRWSQTVPNAKRAILTKFADIVCLRLSEVKVGAFTDFAHLICAFPSLESLALDYVGWNDGDAASTRQPFPPSLRALEARESQACSILEWLLSSETVPPLHILYIHSNGDIQSNVLDKLLLALGSSLRKFEICLESLDHPISLSANERLTSVNFEVSCQLDCQKIVESLPSITSPLLEEICFRIDDLGDYHEDEVDWSAIDAVLEGQQFSKVNRVVIAFSEELGLDGMFAPRSPRLPKCHSRGVLIVKEVDSLFWNI